MTITQIVQSHQQQRIGELTQKQQGKPHINPYGTPGMSLNDAGNYRKVVPVDEGVVQQVKQIAFDHMKNGYGVSDGEDISKVIRDYTMSLAPEKRLSASWTLNEIFHSEATRLGEFVHQQNPNWDWGKPFNTSILDGYRQGVDRKAYDRVEIGTHPQTDTRSGTYKPSSGQIQAMGNPSYTWAVPDSRLQAELLPPSEQSSYTEEDALINQYMKQSRIDGYFDGSTFVRTSSEPVKLILKDDISKTDLEKFNRELVEKGLGEDIDWRGVQEDFVQIGVGFDNIERFEQKADYLASRYAVLKDHIETQFTGERQEAELQKLEQIYTQAKNEMANSYAENIGDFFEVLGQSGATADMRNSVLALVDQKTNAYTDYIGKADTYASITAPDKQWLKQDDAYMAFQNAISKA